MSKSNGYSEKSRDVKITKLGELGERIIAQFFRSKRGGEKEITESLDPYDYTKDMVIDGKTVEIKTQVPFYNKNCFSFKTNQLKKCLSVDIVYFVSVPKNPNHHSAGCIYEWIPNEDQVERYTTKDNRQMVSISIDHLNLIHVITDEKLLGSLVELSVSEWSK